jgi:hypothetical protein
VRCRWPFLVVSAVGDHRTSALPQWARTGSVLWAIVNVGFIPSVFYGMNPENFYAANGWGSTASIGALFMLWTGTLGLAILRTPTTDQRDLPTAATQPSWTKGTAAAAPLPRSAKSARH